MANQTDTTHHFGGEVFPTDNPSGQAFKILYFGYVLLPILAGIDKFFNYLVDWTMYLAPFVTQTFPIRAQEFMYIVGVVEILAGIITLIRPSIGGYIIAIWLWGIILNLFLIPGYFDIALRDFGLSLGALALARLSLAFKR